MMMFTPVRGVVLSLVGLATVGPHLLAVSGHVVARRETDGLLLASGKDVSSSSSVMQRVPVKMHRRRHNPVLHSVLVAVPRGGASSPVAARSRSLVRRWLDAVKAFLASFFDPKFGAEPPQRAAAVPGNKKAPGGGSPAARGGPSRAAAMSSSRRAKRVTVADLRAIEGGTVQAVQTASDFQRRIASNKLVVTDFWASWCGPCQQMKPKFAAISDRFAKRATFLAVDVDKAKPIAQQYAVSSMPTFVFFKNGKELDRFSGADEAKLESAIARLA